MTTCSSRCCFDLAKGSLNKQGEELCGDQAAFWTDGSQAILILADGLGSGVKANILATLTTRIALTLLKKDATAAETFETILTTLPTCRVRGIAYCTLAIVRADSDGQCSIFEYDTPPAMLIRNGTPLALQREEAWIRGRRVGTTRCRLEPGDCLMLVSDGAIHAGLGNVFNHGWEWENVQDYVARINPNSAAEAAARLLATCRGLYGGSPGDDTTVAALMLKPHRELHLLVGPPADAGLDGDVVAAFMEAPGEKVLCGGTTAALVARELRRPLTTSMEYPDPEVPPTATLEGVALVTEGVVTLNAVLRHLEAYREHLLNFDPDAAGGAAALCRKLLFDCTHVHFWVGTAENPAHNHPEFHRSYLPKQVVLERLMALLPTLGKTVTHQTLK